MWVLVLFEFTILTHLPTAKDIMPFHTQAECEQVKAEMKAKMPDDIYVCIKRDEKP